MDKVDMSGSSANNSSDFVHKLYKMLEDPSYDQVVRWGNEGDSFVVLENEKFTKSILPKHFKHSNFASFVRQLNKYDFHKVRQSNEDNGQSPYGPTAWEFKHPEFQLDKKDSLDNIRRKAPVPRKAAQSTEDVFPAQQIDLVNTQLAATQHQLQNLQELYNDLADGHGLLLRQVIQLQKIVKNHDGVMRQVMGFLHTVDAQRRASSVSGGLFTNMSSSGMGMADLARASVDLPASPLQQASQLLGEYSAENLVSRDLEQRATSYNFMSDYRTPSQEQASSIAGPSSDGASAHTGYISHSQDLESLVYPIGQTNGINPINREHIHNIPYAVPLNTGISADPRTGVTQTRPPMERQKKSFMDPGWGIHKPRVLLVEDDATCARIGCKFLQNFECGVETAANGIEAVNKMNQNPNRVDLILMDIIMPHLDGVSATVCIRNVAQTTPIIAMTSNIRADDIDMYFRYGMNDVLPKPFTKEGMLRTLEKHLAHFKKDYIPPLQIQHQEHFTNTNTSLNINISQMPAPHSLKEEPPRAKSGSPSTSSWNSPNTMSTSPTQQSNQSNQGGQYIMTTSHSNASGGYQTQPSAPTMSGHGGRSGPQRRGISEIEADPDETLEKRQRIYPPAPPRCGSFT